MSEITNPVTTNPVTLADTNAVRALTTVEVAERLIAKAHYFLDQERPDVEGAMKLLAAAVDETTSTTASLVKTQDVSDTIGRAAVQRVREIHDRAG